MAWRERLLLLGLPVATRLAARWAREEEQRILRQGAPLTMEQVVDARAAGVRSPERVRVLRTPSVPIPYPMLAGWAGFAAKDTAGMTLGYGIFIEESFWDDRLLWVHEMVHVAQYERLGGLKSFLREYLHECLSVGYGFGPLEREAMAVSQWICEP